jgi:putative flavoprotein involved in K+ transport
MRTDMLVIGAGQAGLAVSRHLSQRGVEHLVVEQGRPGQAWRSRRWDSFRLVTPNWFTRLPGLPDGLADGDGFMSAPEMFRVLERYAAAIAAPVWPGVRVVSLRHADPGYLVRAEEDGSAVEIRASKVVAATGAYQGPHLPHAAARAARRGRRVRHRHTARDRRARARAGPGPR